MISKPELLTEEHDCSTFDCGKAALNDWLKSYALSNQIKGFSRVIVVGDGKRVVGFYGLAPTAVAPQQSSRTIKDGTPSKSDAGDTAWAIRGRPGFLRSGDR